MDSHRGPGLSPSTYRCLILMWPALHCPFASRLPVRILHGQPSSWIMPSTSGESLGCLWRVLGIECRTVCIASQHSPECISKLSLLYAISYGSYMIKIILNHILNLGETRDLQNACQLFLVLAGAVSFSIQFSMNIPDCQFLYLFTFLRPHRIASK